MAITDQHLKAKAAGIVSALSGIPADKLRDQPSFDFAQDYNSLRTLALDLHPNLANVAPPALTIQRGGLMPNVGATYAELLAYANQIRGLLQVGNGSSNLSDREGDTMERVTLD